MVDNAKRQEKWFQTALEQELDAIGNLLPDLNIYKPNNPFWQSLFRIAGLVKAGYISKEMAFSKIQIACQHLTLRDKDIEYQWNRAYQRATARYLKV